MHTEYLILRTNYIQQKFSKFLKTLSVKIADQKNEVNNEVQKILINRICFAFEHDDSSDICARAYSKEQLIIFNIGKDQDYELSFCHELAHLFLDYYKYIIHDNKSGAHCLEFAIVSYCISWRMYSDDKNICFFNSYDISDDAAYPNLSLNPCKFDSLIKIIEWDSIEELITKAHHMSKKIRARLVV